MASSPLIIIQIVPERIHMTGPQGFTRQEAEHGKMLVPWPTLMRSCAPSSKVGPTKKGLRGQTRNWPMKKV
jgi:hypothetical protein